MKVAIIGCGLIGEKRAKALGKTHQLVITADKNIERLFLGAERLVP